jgi:hypothetical protein
MISGKSAWKDEMPAIPEGDKKLLLYLSNQQLKTLVSEIAEKEITIAVLPHPFLLAGSHAGSFCGRGNRSGTGAIDDGVFRARF